jgi:putative hydrolase of the HAD superfamily
MIKEVWFDTNGTLYKETPEFDAALTTYVCKELGVVTGEADTAKLQALHKELYGKYSSNSAVFQSLGMPADYWQGRFEEFDPNTLLKPDVEIAETLRKLKDLLPLGVFTNARMYMLEDMLRHLAIPSDFFTHKLSAVDVGKPKPDLAGFRRMVEISGVDAAEILYVGDKVSKDILPAKQVGMLTCLLWTQSPEADFCAANFPELLGVVSSNAAR